MLPNREENGSARKNGRDDKEHHLVSEIMDEKLNKMQQDMYVRQERNPGNGRNSMENTPNNGLETTQKHVVSPSADFFPISLEESSTNRSKRSDHENSNQEIQVKATNEIAGSIKEWKPKPTHAINQAYGPATVSESSVVSAEATIQLPPVSKVLDSKEAASELQKKLENLRVPPRQHVILPNHIFVPESEMFMLHLLQDLEDGELVRILSKCSHVYHLECIDKWLQRQGVCPILRTYIFQ